MTCVDDHGKGAAPNHAFPQEVPIVPDVDLGEKRACSDCGILFFTLNRPSPTCPKCGQEARDSRPRSPAALQKPDVADVVDDPADETKQEDEFEEDADAVALGTSPKPAIQDEPSEDE